MLEWIAGETARHEAWRHERAMWWARHPEWTLVVAGVVAAFFLVIWGAMLVDWWRDRRRRKRRG